MYRNAATPAASPVGKLPAALLLYKSRLSEAVRLIVRTCVLEFLSVFDPTAAVELLEDTTSGADADTPFATRVRGMPSESFLACLSMCFENLLQALQRCESVYLFVERKLSQPDDLPGPAAPGSADHDVILSLNKSCKTSCCELAQRSLSQLISLRKDANAKLSVEKMKFMWESSLSFVSSMEAISGSTAYEVRQCLMVQTKHFLDHLHETFKGRLVNTLDNERWVQCDVAPERQAGVDRLVSGKAFLQQAGTGDANRQAGSSSGTASSTEADSSSRKKDARPVLVLTALP